MDRYGDWGKWLALPVTRRHRGTTLAELGQSIGGKDYAAVGMGLKYFEGRLQNDKALQKIRHQAIKILYLKT